MKFFEAMGEITDNIGAKANNAMEVSRLGSKISAETKGIASLKQEMGEYCWEQYKAGTITDETLISFCEAIKTSEEKIRSMKAEAKKLKESSPKSILPKEKPFFCPSCGAEMKPDMKFCGACGNPLEQPKPEAEPMPQPEIKHTCKNCGTLWDSELQFCGNCGAKLGE